MGQYQPEIVAAAFLLLYMVLGSPFLYQVLIVTQVWVQRGMGRIRGTPSNAKAIQP